MKNKWVRTAQPGGRCDMHLQENFRQIQQERLSNDKVSVRQQCVYMKAPSEEIYGKSTQGT